MSRQPAPGRDAAVALDFLRYDLVADIGAGDSYSDIYGITRFRNMDFTKSWARRLRRQYILLPQTIGPYASEEAAGKPPVDERSPG